MAMPKKIVLGYRLSFENPLGDDTVFLLSDCCHYKKSTNTLYLQAPKMEQLRSIMSRNGFTIVLDDRGKSSYDNLTRVRVTLNEKNKRFIIKLPDYPSYPIFNKSKVKRWTWKNMVRQLKMDKPVYEAKHLFQLIEAISWLENEGYVVTVSDAVSSYLPPGRDGAAVIEHMERSNELHLGDHQIDCVREIDGMDFKGIIGDHAGLGKTISGGEILFNLWTKGLVKRALWVVPTSPLVIQVIDEMKNRYGLSGKAVTGQTVKPKERLGVVKGRVVDKTIYEKHGFTTMTWSMYVRDFTGKNFHEFTKNVHFDVIFWDEGHRALYGNKAFEAVLNMSAPYRIILSGTIMPNGRWEELHDMVSSVSPSSVMAKWYFTNVEDEKASDYAVGDDDDIDPDYEARMDVTRMALAMLMKRVTIHSKEDLEEPLPKLVESSMHVPLNDEEQVVLENMIDMLGGAIDEWKKAFRYKHGNDAEKSYYKKMESVKNILWQDLRRFCSHGAFHLERRMDEITSSDSPIHGWIVKNFPKQIREVKEALASGKVRSQPKNKKVLSALRRVDPERCLVFNDSVAGSIRLARYLKERGVNVKVIVGSDDQFSQEDADFLDQPRKIKDDVVEDLLEWFWFPWMTVAKLADLDDRLSITYTGEDGTRRNRLYYVNAHRLGKAFSITVEWNEKIPSKVYKKILAFIDEVSASPAYTVDAEVPPKAGTSGRVIIGFKQTKERDQRVLVTTDKLNEGANLQIAKMIVFYDAPMSIKQKEQRIARARRMESMHDVIVVVSIMMGLDYAIGRAMDKKYATAQRLGYADAKSVSMKDALELMRDEMTRPRKDVDLLDFLGGEGS